MRTFICEQISSDGSNDHASLTKEVAELRVCICNNKVAALRRQRQRLTDEVAVVTYKNSIVDGANLLYLATIRHLVGGTQSFADAAALLLSIFRKTACSRKSRMRSMPKWVASSAKLP